MLDYTYFKTLMNAIFPVKVALYTKGSTIYEATSQYSVKLFISVDFLVYHQWSRALVCEPQILVTNPPETFDKSY